MEDIWILILSGMAVIGLLRVLANIFSNVDQKTLRQYRASDRIVSRDKRLETQRDSEVESQEKSNTIGGLIIFILILLGLLFLYYS